MKKTLMSLMVLLASTHSFAASDDVGKKLTEQFLRDKSAVILLYGGMAKTPLISLIFTKIEAWDALPQDKKEGVCLYMSNFVAKAKNDPTPYINIPTSAPVYPFVVSNAKNMCSGCWSIMSNDGYIIVGDEAWEQLEYKGRSQSFSKFASAK